MSDKYSKRLPPPPDPARASSDPAKQADQIQETSLLLAATQPTKALEHFKEELPLLLRIDAPEAEFQRRFAQLWNKIVPSIAQDGYFSFYNKEAELRIQGLEEVTKEFIDLLIQKLKYH